MMNEYPDAHAVSAPPGRGLAAIASGVLLLLLALLTGCAAFKNRDQPNAGDNTTACTAWYAQLDAATREAGVRDGGAHRLAGFPFLRSNRFLAAMGDALTDNPEAFETWIGRLAELDREARAAELSNLPLQFVPPLATQAGAANAVDRVDAAAAKTAIAARTAQCGAQAQGLLVAAARASRPDRLRLAARAQVPDDYSGVKRALGLYPLTRVPFFKGVERWQQSAADQFAVSASQAEDPAEPLTRYTPAGSPVAAELIAAIYARRQPDALGMARLGAADEALLLRAFAPDLDIETRGPYDRFGPLHWVAGAAAAESASTPSPHVAAGQPVMYQRIAYTRHQGQTLMQLVYSVWFSERPTTGGIDLLGGKLDSVVLRLTLAPDGTPWLYDSIHSCGCYHLFFTTPRAVPKPPPAGAAIEWAFVPTTLPAMPAGQRVVMRLASGTHYVAGLKPLATDAPAAPVAKRAAAMAYQLMHDSALRNLPVINASAAAESTPAAAAGVTRSAFWPSGLVPGTERGERALFWPMGIDNPGAMRQWGRQPTAFVGRRHFDDARLLELRFELLPR